MLKQTEKYVAKGNELVEGISDLEMLDFKLVNLVISKIDSVNDNDLRVYTLKKREIMDYLNLKKNYIKLDNLLKSIPYKKVIINTIDKYTTCYWFHVSVTKSYVEFRIDANLKPYLIKLTKDFTQFELSSIRKFKSKYSFKFYEWFLMKHNKNKAYRDKTSFVIEIKKIKENLFLPKSYSKNFNDIKRRVINPSVDDINTYTTLSISYTLIYSGVKVEKVEFIIESKNVLNEKNHENHDEITKGETLEINVKRDAKEFFNRVWNLYPLRKGKANIKISEMITLQKLGYDTVKTCIDRYLEYITEKKKEGFNQGIQNGYKFFTKGYIDYLDENYSPYKAQLNQNNSKPTQSTNFEQRKYDDEFFESLYDNF